MPSVKPYSVSGSDRRVEEIFSDVNRHVFSGNGPDYTTRAEEGLVANPLAEYGKLMKWIGDRPDWQGVPFAAVDFSVPPPSDKVTVIIRHDVDVDVVVALQMAELERLNGIASSWYMLHTSLYYGEFRGSAFHRFIRMASVYRQFEEKGHEVGFHTDGLHLYQNLKLNGAEAIQQEIEWLRSEGLSVTGTVAHNRFDVYGAENFAIFKGKPQRGRDKPEDCPKEVIHHGKWAPLQVLDEKEMGLNYEANEIFWQTNTPVRYGAPRWAYTWRWVDNISRADAPDIATTKGFVNTDRIYENLEQVELGSYVVLAVHPVYYGLRHRPDSAPLLEGESIQKSRFAGWSSYSPRSIQVVDEGNSIVWTNERGMVDKSFLAKKKGDVKALWIGGAEVSASHLPEMLHAHSLAEKQFADKAEKTLRITKLAHSGVGLAAGYAWFSETVDEVKPDFVMLHVGPDEVRLSSRDHWSKAEGWSSDFPPGKVLDLVEDKVCEVEASELADFMRKPHQDVEEAESDWDSFAPILKYFCSAIRKKGASPIVIAENEEIAKLCSDWVSSEDISVLTMDCEDSLSPWSLKTHEDLAAQWVEFFVNSLA
jgi:hypothetical protein